MYALCTKVHLYLKSNDWTEDLTVDRHVCTRHSAFNEENDMPTAYTLREML